MLVTITGSVTYRLSKAYITKQAVSYRETACFVG